MQMIKNTENGSINFLMEKKDFKFLNLSEKDVKDFIDGKADNHIFQIFINLEMKMCEKAINLVESALGFKIYVQMLDNFELMFYLYVIDEDDENCDYSNDNEFYEEDMEDAPFEYIMEQYSYNDIDVPKYILISKFDDLKHLSYIDIPCTKSILHKEKNKYVLELRGSSLDYYTFLFLSDIGHFIEKTTDSTIIIPNKALEKLKNYFEIAV